MSTDLLLGYESLDEAVNDTEFTSQSEALTRLLMGESVFLSGVAGAGKSFVVEKFIELLENHFVQQGVNSAVISKAIVVTASTGLASANIGGSTIHSFSGLNMCQEPIDKKKVRDKDYRKTVGMSNNFYVHNMKMQKAEVVIIDEISMLDSVFIDNLDILMKLAKKNNAPFGGVKMVFVGDFMQLPPVSKSANKESEAGFAFEANAWKELDPKLLFLSKPQRSADDRMNVILKDMREQRVSKESKDFLLMCKNNKEQDSYVRLYTKNKNVDKYNSSRLEALPGEEKEYVPTFNVNFAVSPVNQSPNCDLLEKKEELIKKAAKTLSSNEGVVKLKVGAVVIITANISDYSVFNGDSGVVEEMGNDYVTVKLNRDGRSVIIANTNRAIQIGVPYKDPRIATVKNSGNEKGELDEGIIRDFININYLPVKLSFAITVHKSQGQTLHGVVADLSNCFSPGLGYVAMSRVASLDNLSISKIGKSAFWADSECSEMSKLVEESAKENKEEFLEQVPTYSSYVNNLSLLLNVFWNADHLLAVDSPAF